MNAKLLGTFIGFVFLLTCGRTPETHYFTLEWQQLSNADLQRGGVLHIQNFDATPMLKNDKMIYKTSRYQIKYDNYRRWVMAPNSLLTYKAAEYFVESGLFDSVVFDIPRGSDSLSLFGRVNHFEEIDCDGEHKVVVSISFELTSVDTREPLLHTTIEKQAPVAGGAVDDIVAAMSQATKLVFDDLASKIAELLE
ncbi:membrane integrity-associated transporter subunit PqiC [candidate division KSB1 bacterium]|nr:membrane integrity-associated transporter subunit PqiC [candidate division KSB1 bacterium]